jgi:hypothetical protein
MMILMRRMMNRRDANDDWRLNVQLMAVWMWTMRMQVLMIQCFFLLWFNEIYVHHMLE